MRYGVLFTCKACRAILVETANSLITDSCINCLRCFFKNCGPIRQLISDRGTGFVGAERKIREPVSEILENSLPQFLFKRELRLFRFQDECPCSQSFRRS